MRANRTAIVIKSTGSWYTLQDPVSGEITSARIKGRMRLTDSRSTNPVVVGDRVDYETDDSGVGTITTVLPRRNYIIRRASNLSKESHIIAANLDHAFLVVTLTQPVTNYEFIDRFLVTAEAYHIPTTLLLNKTDLYTSEELIAQREEFHRIYTDAGYDILEIVALDKAGIEPMRERLRNKTSLLSGNSGVGKSTLIRAIDPSLEIRTGAISDSHHKGKHTTTFSEMYPLQEGGYIIDTPGIKGFGLIDIESNEICRYFPDLFRYAPDCSYYNCTHTHEPSCAVKTALAKGQISESRYVSYLKLLEDDEKHRK